MVELRKEQKRVVEFDSGNMLVTASAGSGKTHVMIERAIRLISEGKATVKEILAVTFTEAAAEEMKERLKKALIQKVKEGKEYLADQINEVSVADVSTIHSFCAKLIRRYFFTCSVSPDFKVIDENQSNVIKRESLEKVFKNLYDLGEDWFITLTSRYKKRRSDYYLKELILDLQNFVSSEAYPEKLIDKFYETYDKKNFKSLKEEYKKYVDLELKNLLILIDELNDKCFNYAFDKGLDILTQIKEYVESGINGDLYDVIKLNQEKISLAFGKNLPEEQENLREEIKLLYARVKSRYKRYSDNLTTEEQDLKSFDALIEHTEKLVKLLKLYLKEYADEKREENSLDFNDLEHFALEVLSNENALKEIKNTYKFVFADEYQDVNGVQEEIITKVSNGNLFMVGDAKQSIYGFRGCLSDAFNNKEKQMRLSGERVETLNANFRSSNKVIDTVNRVFSYCMTESFQGVNYKEDSMLNPGGKYPPEATGRSELHFLVDDRPEKPKGSSSEKPRVYNLLDELNAQTEDENQVSELIKNIINDELGKTYYHPKEERFKRITYGDIAVLARSVDSSYLKSIVSGLESRGIPISSKVSRIALDFPEIKVLVNLLKLIDCFYQDVPLFIVLKSVIGGFSEEELVKISEFYKEKFLEKYYFHNAFIYAGENLKDELGKKVRKFIEYIENVRFLADFLGAKKTLEKVIEDVGYENYCLADEWGDKKLSRINLFLSRAKKENSDMTIKEFLKYIENNPKAFEISDCSEENNVSVLTMHKSKGLEFPVVIVCGLNNPSNVMDESAEVLLDREYGFATKLFIDDKKTSSSTFLRGLVKERIAQKRRKEEQRLFYVALTRAGYSLHMVGEGKTDTRRKKFCFADKFLDFVPSDILATLHSYSELKWESKKIEKKQVLFGKLNEEKVDEIKKNLNYVYLNLEDVELPLKATVTGVTNVKEEYYATYKIGDEDKTSAKAGTVAHKVLETYSFDEVDLSVHVKELVKDGIITKEDLELINVERIKAALSLDIFKKLKGGRLYKEQPFITALPASKVFKVKSEEKVLVQGIIDLIVELEEGFIIIDYKYSRLDGERLKEKYSPQLELYSLAVQKALKKKVLSKILVNVYSGETVIL